MFKKIMKILKAAIKSIIVAFLFVIVIGIGVVVIGKEEIAMAAYMLQLISVQEENVEKVIPVLEDGILTNYPTFGTKYATLKIPGIGLEQPVYYGANNTILNSGIAHDQNSYFPGEGGSVIYAGHNFSTILADLPNLVEGDQIIIDSNYGIFEYEVFGSKIIKDIDVEEVPIQKDKEMLMIYTCWPINNFGRSTERYVVYANLVK